MALSTEEVQRPRTSLGMSTALCLLPLCFHVIDTDNFSIYLTLISKASVLDFKAKEFWLRYRVTERSLSVRLVPFTYVKGEFYRRRIFLKIICLRQSGSDVVVEFCMIDCRPKAQWRYTVSRISGCQPADRRPSGGTQFVEYHNSRLIEDPDLLG